MDYEGKEYEHIKVENNEFYQWHPSCGRSGYLVLQPAYEDFPSVKIREMDAFVFYLNRQEYEQLQVSSEKCGE